MQGTLLVLDYNAGSTSTSKTLTCIEKCARETFILKTSSIDAQFITHAHFYNSVISCFPSPSPPISISPTPSLPPSLPPLSLSILELHILISLHV